jgi:hypothetical protein
MYARYLIHTLTNDNTVRTAFSTGLNENGFFDGVEWGRLFRLGQMGTVFSTELNGDGFFNWVKWERLFHMG